MGYFSYHATAKRLLKSGKLLAWYYTARHNQIAPALVLVFDDANHRCMPIRAHRWPEYLGLLPADRQINDPRGGSGRP